MGQIVFFTSSKRKVGSAWSKDRIGVLARMISSGSWLVATTAITTISSTTFSKPLFYDTLATDRGHEAWCNRFKLRIPFLNGGLFESLADYDWRKTDIVLPNKLFTNTECNDTGDIGTASSTCSTVNNFTVNEAEPLEKEVAIGPRKCSAKCLRI